MANSGTTDDMEASVLEALGSLRVDDYHDDGDDHRESFNDMLPETQHEPDEHDSSQGTVSGGRPENDKLSSLELWDLPLEREGYKKSKKCLEEGQISR